MQNPDVVGNSDRTSRRSVLALIRVILLLPLPASAASVTLAWNPSTDPTVVGYHLYYGGVSQTYTNMVPVGAATNGSVTGLIPGGRSFFAATAVNVAGLESPFSNEASYQVQGSTLLPLVVTAANQSRSYGATNPPLTGTISGLQNGDNITATYSTVATPASPARAYSIVPTLVDPNGKLTNYTVTITSGTLTVSPAALTITAANASKVFGAPLPAFSPSYSGFANGDAASSLTTPPALSTTATAASAVGSYPITASGAAGSNYTISYVAGTLSIHAAASAAVVTSSTNPAPPGSSVTFTTALSAVAPGAGVPAGSVQFMINGAPAGSPVSLSGGTASYSTSALGRGNHTVAAQYGGNGNFTGTTNALAVAQLVDTSPSAGAAAIAYRADHRQQGLAAGSPGQGHCGPGRLRQSGRYRLD